MTLHNINEIKHRETLIIAQTNSLKVSEVFVAVAAVVITDSLAEVASNVSHEPGSLSCRPVSRKSRKHFRKAISETTKRLFWKADLLTCMP